MKIKVLGSGGALGDKFDTNFLIETDQMNRKIAFDCGRTWPEAMRSAGEKWEDVMFVFVSHTHADHVGGLEFLGFSSYFKKGFPFGNNKPTLVGTWEIINDLWEKTLKGGMESLQGQVNTLETFFNLGILPPNGRFIIDNVLFSIVQTVHVVDNRRIKPSTGLMIELRKERECYDHDRPLFMTSTHSNFLNWNNVEIEKRVFITGDTQFAPNQIRGFYEIADCIIQDCELAKYPASVHAQYHELCTLPEDIKKKMWLVHYDGDLPSDWEERGFLGFLKEGQVIEV